jgi:hypothetical protein
VGQLTGRRQTVVCSNRVTLEPTLVKGQTLPVHPFVPCFWGVRDCSVGPMRVTTSAPCFALLWCRF